MGKRLPALRGVPWPPSEGLAAACLSRAAAAAAKLGLWGVASALVAAVAPAWPASAASNSSLGMTICAGSAAQQAERLGRQP